MNRSNLKAVLLANTDWYLYNFRFSLAHRMREQGWQVILASPPGMYTAKLEKEGFRWVPITFSRRGMVPHRELSTLIQLEKFYKQEQPHLLHNFTIKPVLYASIVAQRLEIPAVVNSITGLGYLFLSEAYGVRLLKSLVMPIYRYVLNNRRVRVIFENESDKVFFLNNRLVKATQTFVIQGAGVDIMRFAPTSEGPEPPIVLMAARLLGDKGVREFVEAARLLGDKLKARFVLVGSPDPGNPTTIPVSTIESWVGEGLIEWWGRRDDMPNVFAQCHIVVLPSYREGVPTVLLEAAASGRPIVASDVPGCRDVVKHGETGFLVRKKDPRSLADALEALIKDKDLRRRMGRSGRMLVEQRFDRRIINDQILRVYHDALGMEGKIA